MQGIIRYSLNAVRVFESAARCGSMLLAAEELGVTPGAVSHQIRGLEDTLGVRLFDRRNNSIGLTDVGRRFHEETAPALAMIERAVGTLRRDASEAVLRVSVSLAVRWLIPALERFKAREPSARIRVETTHYAKVALGGSADIAISYLRHDEDGEGELLFRDVCRPMLSPALLAASNYAGLDEVAHVPALKATADNWDWRLWARAAGVPFEALDFAHAFDTDDAAIHAATAGLGMVLATPVMTLRELSAGSLVELPDAPNITAGELRILVTERPSPLIRRLARWLREEAGKIA